MHLPEPLRSSPFQMYKRKSLYSGQYGHSSPRLSNNAGSMIGGNGTTSTSRPSPVSKTYMQGLPTGYAPHPGAMPVQNQNYLPYTGLATPSNIHSSQHVASDEFMMSMLERGRTTDLSMERERDDMTEQDFIEDNGGFNPRPLKLRQNTEAAREFLKARTEGEAAELGDEIREQMLEIQMAVEQIRGGSHSNPQDFFEQQEQTINAEYDELQHEMFGYGPQVEEIFDAQEALFDMAEAESPSLEQLVEASGMLEEGPMPNEIGEMADYDDGSMVCEPSEQQMYGGPEQMEPYPDGGMMPQEMCEEQVQEMMDPYMMPGMPDPCMMPGPMGPGPMLDPGPGGPP